MNTPNSSTKIAGILTLGGVCSDGRSAGNSMFALSVGLQCPRDVGAGNPVTQSQLQVSDSRYSTELLRFFEPQKTVLKVVGVRVGNLLHIPPNH